MTKWIFAAITFGILAVAFLIGAMTSSRAVADQGVQFLASPSGRYGLTTTDRVGVMAFATFISSCGCLGSIAAAFRARRQERTVGDDNINQDSDTPAWTCPFCHEKNPGNFEECWKCQRDRRGVNT